MRIMSNLLEKASILTTPTAYNDGKLLSVKGGTQADFDFTRGSTATRVNSSGLIESVQILSGELVANGDFATDSDWSKGTGWSIANGEASQDNSTPNSGDLIQPNVTVSGKKYSVTLDVNVTSGTLSLILGGHNLFNTSGTKTFIKTASSTNLTFRNYSNFIGSIDNVSVKEITEDTDLPRIDYTDGVGSILLEPQSTNIYPNSEPTSVNSFKTGITFQQTDVFDWNGIYYGDNSVRRIGYMGVSTIVGTNYTFSFFVKMSDGTFPSIGDSGTDDFRVFFSSATTSGLVVTNISNGIYKCSVNKNATSTNSLLALEKTTSNSSKSFEVSGFQLEQQSFPTSYIPTNGTPVTRNPETLNNAGSSDLINSTEGVLYAEIAALSDDLTFREISISSGHSSNSIAIKYRNTSNVINFTIVSGGSSVFNTSETVPSIKDFNKVALKYKSGDIAIWINGVEMTTSASLFTNTSLSEISFDNGSGYSDFYGKVKSVAVFKEALTDAELTCLTTI